MDEPRAPGEARTPCWDHGGNLWAAARVTGRRPEEWLDFSASINPLGAPGWVRAAITRALSTVEHYPDPDAADLRAAAAAAHGLPPEQVRFGNGAAELIHLLVAVLQPSAGMVLAPTFGRYRAALEAFRVPVTEIPAWPEVDGWGLLHWLQTAPPEGVAFLCQPNNPTGSLLPPDLMEAALAAAADRGVWLVVDEAFLDFVPGAESLAPRCARHPRLVVLRSLTKLYAIPGLRLGYAVGPAPLISRLAARQGPWAVNGVATAAGLAAFTGPDYRPATWRAVAQERAWMMRQLAGLPGVTPFPSKTNYCLVRLAAQTGSRLQERLLPAGILIRTCTSFTGLGDDYVRLAARPRQETRALLNHLAAVLR